MWGKCDETVIQEGDLDGVEAVLAREIWGQPVSHSPQSPLCKFLNPKLGKPLLPSLHLSGLPSHMLTPFPASGGCGDPEISFLGDLSGQGRALL